jgi:hypothetical protein
LLPSAVANLKCPALKVLLVMKSKTLKATAVHCWGALVGLAIEKCLNFLFKNSNY